MKKANEADLLDQTILSLQIKQADEFDSLREQFHTIFENLTPYNLIKNTFSEITDSSNIKNTILTNIIGITTGYLSRKFFLGKTHHPIKRVLGSLLQFAVTNVVSKRSKT